MLRRSLLAISLCFIFGLPALAAEGRTLHQRLGSTPEAAARSFVEAWRARDFSLAWIMMGPKATQSWARNLAQNYSHRPYFKGDVATIDAALFGLEKPAFDEIWFATDQMFDVALTAADKAGALPFDFDAAATIRPDKISDRQASFRAGAATLTVTRTLAGFWKVEQITFPGSDPTRLPWGFAATP